MKKVLGLVLLVFVVAAGVVVYKAHEGGVKQSDPFVDVGLIQLLQNPGEFDGKKVRVIGFMHQSGDDNAIYLHQEDTVQANALWVETTASQTGLGGHYVICEGVYDSSNHGHAGAYGGDLVKVSKATLAP
jgi:hypothetical protein